jgi:predicted acylesterase/phospholipase RssA
MPPPLDLVFSGGGSRGVGLAGAIEVLERHKPVIRRVVGTSAGSVAAVFGASGFLASDYLKLVPSKPGDPFTFSSFVAPPAGDKVREAARKKDSETRHLLRGMVDGAIDKFLTNVTQRRPRIGELMQGAFAIGKQPIYEAAFEGFIDRIGDRDADPKNPRKTTYLFSMLEFGGIFDPDLFRTWLVQQLSVKVPELDAKTTLAAFQKMTANVGRELSVVTADTADQKPLVLNHRTAPDCPVVEAVVMSCSVPLVWPETPWRREWGTYLGRDIEGHPMVDGAVLANFAMHYVLHRDDPEVRQIMGEPDKEKGAVIGLLIDAGLAVPGDVAPAEKPELKLLDRVNRLLGTLSAWQREPMKEYDDLVCRVGTRGHPPMEFQQTPEAIQRLQALVNSGRCAMIDYLKKRKLF